MRDRLIVGFDGSTTSLAALRWAATEAERRKASVRVLSSYWMPAEMNFYGIGTTMATPGELDRLEQSCRSALESAVSTVIHEHPAVGFDYHVERVTPAACLLTAATTADLLVVGSNGMGAARSYLLGSVTEHVLHDSTTPVVVVPEATPAPASARDGVFVGVDGSDASIDALLWAADEADRWDTELTVMHAWDYPYRFTDDGVGRGSAFAQVDGAIVLEQSMEAARERMAGEVNGQLVEGSAAQALIDASATARLVVVGSRGHGGLRSMLLGSVARAAASRASCPVVVVR